MFYNIFTYIFVGFLCLPKALKRLLWVVSKVFLYFLIIYNTMF